MTVGDVSLSLDHDYTESLLGVDLNKKESKKHGRLLNLLKANAPETRPKLWLCINLACAAAASFLVSRLYTTSILHEGFPKPIYITYTMLVAVIWCFEALTSLLVVRKSDKYQLCYVYVELSVAIYYLFAAAYLLVNGSALKRSDKDSAMPDTELDAILYGLSCCYNIYCIKNFDSFMSNMPQEESDVDITPELSPQGSSLTIDNDEKDIAKENDSTDAQDGLF